MTTIFPRKLDCSSQRIGIKDWFSHLYDVDDDVSEAQADQRAFPGGAIDAINPAEGATLYNISVLIFMFNVKFQTNCS